MNIQNTEFLKTAALEKDFPKDGLPQVAFSGRSNVGKSSVINSLTRRKNLARVGASPGKTANINFFKVDGKAYFTDLPGYGYAKVSMAEKERWGKLMESYFSQPERIALGVMIVDLRHKPTEGDMTMAQWFKATGRPFVVVANKSDKLKPREIEENLALIRETLELEEDQAVLPYSAEKNMNREELARRILDSLG